MSKSELDGHPALIVAIENRLCAVPLGCVIETMRPLPVEPIAGAPPFVCGVSLIRGSPSPVVDLGALLGMPDGPRNRFVTLRVGSRRVSLSVSEVVGIREIDPSLFETLPPLLQQACQEVIEAIAILDSQFLLLLRGGWELPEEIWTTLDVQRGEA